MGKFKEYLDTKFELELVKSLQTFIPKQIEDVLKDPTIDYNNYGSDNEILLKNILHYTSNLFTVLKDLDFSLLFLKKERKLILEHYPDLESQEDYYDYHFENYYIRLVSIGDILGRLGNLLYGLELDTKRVNIHNFKDRALSQGHVKISEIAEKLISKLRDLKEERHKKLHTGVSDVKALDGIVLWDELGEKIGSDVDSILVEHTDTEIKDNFENLEKETFEIIDLIKEFLEESTEKITEILKR